MDSKSLFSLMNNSRLKSLTDSQVVVDLYIDVTNFSINGMDFVTSSTDGLEHNVTKISVISGRSDYACHAFVFPHWLKNVTWSQPVKAWKKFGALHFTRSSSDIVYIG